MPGMNSDVSVLVEQRDNVLAVPNDAVRGMKDLTAAAMALNLDPVAVRAALGGGAGAAGNGAPAAVSVSQTQCDSVQAVIAKNPAAQKKLQDLRQQMMSGGDRAAIFPQMKAVYDSLHIDAGVARACAQLRRTSAGGTQMAAGGTVDEQPAAGNTRPRPGLVFIAQNGTFVPKVLTLGVGNYDVTQVLSGLQEGDKVALINAAMLQAARAQRQQQINSRMGLPGVSQQQTGGQRPSGQAGGAATKTAAPAATPPAAPATRPPGTP
jgi:HlyD family secretion protein